MIRLLILCLFFWGAVNADRAYAQGKNGYKYEIASYDGQVAASPGYSLVKVWSYGKREKITRRSCAQNAIHGILFKGYSAPSTRSADKGLKALVPGGYDQNEDYFDKFFSSGDFLQYVQESSNGELATTDVIKIAKREYKVGMIVMVNVGALRARLEQDGIIKKMDFLF